MLKDEAIFSSPDAKCLGNVIAVVEEAKGSAASIAKLTIHITDFPTYRRNKQAIAIAWHARFGDYYPAIAIVDVKELIDPAALVEIEAIACRGKDDMAAQTWNAAGYEANARFVSDLGSPVLQLLAPRPGERILDIGCGDGVLTKKIAEAGSSVVGLDSSPDFCEAVRRLGLEVVECSASDMAFSREFDAVFSNAALHWMKDADNVVRRSMSSSSNTRGGTMHVAPPDIGAVRPAMFSSSTGSGSAHRWRRMSSGAIACTRPSLTRRMAGAARHTPLGAPVEPDVNVTFRGRR